MLECNVCDYTHSKHASHVMDPWGQGGSRRDPISLLNLYEFPTFPRVAYSRGMLNLNISIQYNLDEP